MTRSRSWALLTWRAAIDLVRGRFIALLKDVQSFMVYNCLLRCVEVELIYLLGTNFDSPCWTQNLHPKCYGVSCWLLSLNHAHVIITNGSAAQSQRGKLGALLFGASFVVQSALVAHVIERTWDRSTFRGSCCFFLFLLFLCLQIAFPPARQRSF